MKETIIVAFFNGAKVYYNGGTWTLKRELAKKYKAKKADKIILLLRLNYVSFNIKIESE